MELRKAKENHWKERERKRTKKGKKSAGPENNSLRKMESKRRCSQRKRRGVQGLQTPLQWMGAHSADYKTTELCYHCFDE